MGSRFDEELLGFLGRLASKGIVSSRFAEYRGHCQNRAVEDIICDARHNIDPYNTDPPAIINGRSRLKFMDRRPGSRSGVAYYYILGNFSAFSNRGQGVSLMV